jgi:DNA-binding NtrC family response regulator
VRESSGTTRGRTVALCDSHPDTIELLRAVFEEDGLLVITIDLRDVRAGRLDVGRLRERHPFDVVVFDITLPYQATWQLFCQLRERDLAGLPVVLTTTNERALVALIGAEVQEPVMEIWGKPYDIERLRGTVLEALGLPERRGSSSDRRQVEMTDESDRRAGDRRRGRPDLAHSGAS